MTKAEKLRAKIYNNPKQVSFEDLDKLLRLYGFAPRNSKGSHHSYTRGNTYLITIPYHRPHVREVNVRKVLAVLDIIDGE